MKKLIIPLLMGVGIIFIGTVIAINASILPLVPWQELPGLIPLKQEEPTNLCEDPEVRAYLYAHTMILTEFGSLDSQIKADIQSKNIEGVQRDARDMRLLANAIKGLTAPEPALTYHNALLIYLDTYASTLELLGAGKDDQAAKIAQDIDPSGLKAKELLRSLVSKCQPE